MSKNGKNGKGVLADPTRLQPLDPDEKELITVVVETPKGSRNKYAFDPKQRVFRLKKVLPAGMTFPYDFGFVPRTEADDGDPIDVLVLMDEPAFPGCVLECRPIGKRAVLERALVLEKEGRNNPAEGQALQEAADFLREMKLSTLADGLGKELTAGDKDSILDRQD